MYDNHYIDIVICIDGTASMAPIMDKVKEEVLSYYYKIVDAFDNNGKPVEELRIKIIVFRNYGFDDEPMTVSDFYTLPEQREEFNSFVNGIEAKGGNGGPTNALEAIALALKSDWTTNGSKRRHVIMVYTDKAALPLGEKSGSRDYPKDMLTDLGTCWECVQQALYTYDEKADRLIVFAPKVYPWNDMAALHMYLPIYSKAGTDIGEPEMSYAIEMITGS